jgi:hypothetical protein
MRERVFGDERAERVWLGAGLRCCGSGGLWVGGDARDFVTGGGWDDFLGASDEVCRGGCVPLAESRGTTFGGCEERLRTGMREGTADGTDDVDVDDIVEVDEDDKAGDVEVVFAVGEVECLVDEVRVRDVA